MQTLLEKIDQFPPTLCRLVARKNSGNKSRPMTTDDLSTGTGFSRKKIISISRMETWSGLTMDTVQKFSRACGVDLLRTGKHVKFLCHEQRHYMKMACPKQRDMLRRLMQSLLKQRQ